jgi:hypothetical protein
MLLFQLHAKPKNASVTTHPNGRGKPVAAQNYHLNPPASVNMVTDALFRGHPGIDAGYPSLAGIVG